MIQLPLPSTSLNRMVFNFSTIYSLGLDIVTQKDLEDTLREQMAKAFSQNHDLEKKAPNESQLSKKSKGAGVTSKRR